LNVVPDIIKSDVVLQNKLQKMKRSHEVTKEILNPWFIDFDSHVDYGNLN